MSRRNGGIIGPTNTPVGGIVVGSAGGVWRMNDVLTFVSNNQWPKVPENIENSCRFNNDDTAYLSFTPSAAGNKKTWTWSGWVKLGHFDSSNNRTLFSSRQDSSNSFEIKFDNTDKIQVRGYVGGSKTLELSTSQLFRDTSAWYHIVYALDTTNGTASNRQHLYINGSEVTSFGTETNPSQDNEYEINEAQAHQIGAENGGNLYDGYMAEVVFIDGQQLTPSSFGEFDSTTGIWKPKKIGAFASAGSNSFYLNFKDSSTLGKDESGLSNNFTVNGVASTDQSTDTCVENFATYNPLTTSLGNGTSLSEWNLKIVETGSTDVDPKYFSTIGVSSGKWYAEFKTTAFSTNNHSIGIFATKGDFNDSNSDALCRINYSTSSPNIYAFGSTVQSSLGTTSPGDILAISVDIDNGTVQFYKNGSTYGSQVTGLTSNFSNRAIHFCMFGEAGGGRTFTTEANFGSPPFSISSGNSDANGFGNFEYSVPSGYYALNTTNLNTYG